LVEEAKIEDRVEPGGKSSELESIEADEAGPTPGIHEYLVSFLLRNGNGSRGHIDPSHVKPALGQIQRVVTGATPNVKNRRALDDALRYGSDQVRLRLVDGPYRFTESVPEISDYILD
jgi:hypothetical protein